MVFSFKPTVWGKSLLGSLSMVSFLCAPLWGGRSSRAGCGGCSEAAPGPPQPGLEKQWQEGGPGRRGSAYGERKEVTGEDIPGHREEGACKGKCGSPALQTMVTEQTPGRSNSTPGEPEGSHLKFKDKWAEGEGVAAVCEEPPRSPSQAIPSVGTGRCTLVESSGEGPPWTDLEQDHKHLLEVAGGVANDVSLQVSLVGCKVGTQALVPSPGHPRDPGERSLLPPNDQILVTNPKPQSP